MHIMVLHISEEEKKNLDIFNWPVSSRNSTIFARHFDRGEECYLLKGDVAANTPDGKQTHFQASDLVVFPKGLSCIYHVKKPVRRHYHVL